MDRPRSFAIALGLCALAGCQAQRPPDPTTPPATMPVAAAPAADGSVATSANPRAEQIAKLAASQAQSIDALLAARQNGERGVTVVEPPHADSQQPPVPADPPPAPKPAARDAAPATALRPIPSMADYHPPPDVAPSTTPPPVSSPAIAPPPVQTADPSPPPRPTAVPGDDALAGRLDRTAADNPHDLSAQLDAQLYQFAADQPVPSPDSLAGLVGEDRHILEAVLDGLTNFRTGVRNDPNQLIGDKVKPLLDMAERIRGQADLRIVNACLVHNASGYGKYDPLDSLTFHNGTTPSPGLYFEIENFNSTLETDGLWHTAMVMDVVLYNSAGGQVWAWKGNPINDACHNRRRDFFVAKLLTLPHSEPAGKYTLKITLTDPAQHRVSEKGLTLTYVDGAAAGQGG